MRVYFHSLEVSMRFRSGARVEILPPLESEKAVERA